MAVIVLAWELGGGLGHLVPLRNLGRRLVERGHRVVAVIRDLSRAAQVFEETRISFLQAPFKLPTSGLLYQPPGAYAHILHNIGFGNETELASLLLAWRGLFQYVRPDLVIADHSPTALLALHDDSTPVVMFGTGFCCPPASSPLPIVRPWMRRNEEKLEETEALLLTDVNRALVRINRPRLKSLAALFSGVQETVLTTFPELDHFGARSPAHYFGSIAGSVGVPPSLPEAGLPKLFAYLKPFPGVRDYLKALRNSEASVVLVGDGLDKAWRAELESPRFIWQDGPIDVETAASWCDLAVTNAGHGLTCELLLRGKPLLQIPIVVEQFLLADRVAKLGAGLISAPGNVQAFQTTLREMSSNASYSQSAERFAAHYSSHSSDERMERIVARLEALLPQGD